MKHFSTFNEMLICLAWIVLSLCWRAWADTTSDNCRRPEITSSKSRLPLFIYQRRATVNVTVYHCQYLEKNVCDTEIGKLTYRYSDITQNCLNAFFNKTRKFKDKFGCSHSNNTNEDSCWNDENICRHVSTVLTKFDAEAHIERDKIVLKSGTVCGYSLGFCHDEKEDIDVMWQVQSDLLHYKLKRVNVSDSYYLTLNKKRYAIIELYGKYSALELKNLEGNSWDTQYEGLIVCEELILNADNNRMTDYVNFFFQIKQDLFDFLTEKCLYELRNANSTTLFDKSFLTDLNMKRLETNLEKLNIEFEGLRFVLDIVVYTIIFIFFCLMIAGVFLVCRICRKSSSVATDCVQGPSCSNALNNNYEYIISEYDIWKREM